MPYLGEWGTFIHIPKTGGTFVRKVLGTIPQKIQDHNINRNLKTHDLPSYWRHVEVWTSVREPAEWLASVWAHRQRTGWATYPHQVPWHYLMDILTEYKTGAWGNFCTRVMKNMPGIIGWFYGIHTPPMVKYYKLGPDLYQKLRDIGGDPDGVGRNVNVGKNLPEITDEQRVMVYNAERATYERYGFDPPSCIEEK